MEERRRPGARTLLAYSALRLLLFAAPFFVIWALSGNPTVSAVLATAIGLSLSVVLLDPQRSALSRTLFARLERRRPTTDEAIEDAAIEQGPEGQTSSESDAASPRP